MGQGNFMISHVISRRVAADGHRSPDLLHGLLMLCEGKETPRSLSKVVGMGELDVADMLDRARAGALGRVPAANSTGAVIAQAEALPGLFGALWKRDVIALMLRPAGVMMDAIADISTMAGHRSDPLHALERLRGELKDFGVSIDAQRINGNGKSTYRIIGRNAWRMQKIIANGWAL